MRRTDALRRTMESLSRVYHGEHDVPVEFGSPSRAVPKGEQTDEGYVEQDTVVVSPNVRDELGRDLDGAQELRTIANTLSHEIEHLRESDLTCKSEFMEEYPGYSKYAGMVINVLEDQYIDHTRTQRYPGLRKAQAFTIDALMQNHHRWPRVDNVESRTKAMFEAFRQLAFSGYAKGVQDADDWLREYLARSRPLIEEVRETDSQEGRKDIAHECMDIALEYLPDGQDIDMPDECAVCGDRPPVIIAPILGPVCEQCAPGGHGPGDGSGSGERDEGGDGEQGGQQGGQQPGDDGGGEEGDQPGEEGDGGGEPGPGGDFGDLPDESDLDPEDFGDDDGPGEQSPVSDADGDRDIDPTEWDWLDLDGHEDHTVSIVADDADV